MNTNIDGILENLDKFDIDEKEVLKLQSKMKELKKKVKEKNKPKTITISGQDHNIIKNYCSSLNLNIGDWASKILLTEIEKEIKENSCIIKDARPKEEIEKEETSGIINRYKRSLSDFTILVKSNRIIVNKNFKFIGYSLIDSKPIYDFVGGNLVASMPSHLTDIICQVAVSRSEASLNIFSNMDLDVVTF